MSRMSRLLLFGAALLAGACSSPDDPMTAPVGAPVITAPTVTQQGSALERARHERFAGRMARALQDPAFRRTVAAAIAASPNLERKVHLQAFLDADGARERRHIADLSGEPDADIARDLLGRAIEMYFPVAEHRAQWHGGANILVATAELDTDSPVAFDLMGRTRRLDPGVPPSIPVLMVRRAEMVFHGRPAGVACLVNCEPEAGGTTPGGITPGKGIFMIKSRIYDDHESWFNGKPEFEIHILGQNGTTSRMTSYQCAGEHAGGPYVFDQNGDTWSGDVMLFSQTQLDTYNAQHPGKNIAIMVLEDDDDACEIKIDSTRATNLLKQVSAVYGGWTAAKDSTTPFLTKVLKSAPLIYAVYRAVVSVFASDDDLVGTAVNDPSVANGTMAGANWVIRGDNSVTKGALTLVMR